MRDGGAPRFINPQRCDKLARDPSHPANHGPMEHLLSQDRIVHILSAYGYWTLFLVVALECAGLPLPGETLLIGGAIYAGETGGLSIEYLILAAAAGAVVGGLAGYGVGRVYGAPLLERYGRWFGLTAKRLTLARYLFMRWGAWIVVLGRFVTLLRIWVGVLAGANRFDARSFLLCNAIGGGVWALALGLGAYALTSAFRRVEGPFAIWAFVALLYSIFCAWIYLKRHEARLLREAEAVLAARSAERAS
jgi:membrane protein DedA with SNARE-associated domain